MYDMVMVQFITQNKYCKYCKQYCKYFIVIKTLVLSLVNCRHE